MRSLKIIIPALLIAIVLPGCSRLRQMTRRDYASMEDPFTSRLADEGAVASRDRDRQIADSTGQIRTASQSRDVGSSTSVADRMLASARGNRQTTPGTGPSLSDFVEKADSQVAKARQAAATFGNAATNSADTDMAGMTQFLGQQASASGLTDTAQQLDEDFAEWAAMRKQEWASKAATVDEHASPFLNAANAARQTFNDSQASSPQAAFDETMGSGFRDNEVATPFIQQASGQRFANVANRASSAGFAAPTTSPRIQPKSQAAPGNPFDELMQAQTPAPTSGGGDFKQVASDLPSSPTDSEWDMTPVAPHQPAATDPFVNPAGTTATPKSLDSSFNFDTGWKPSDVVPR